MLMIEKRQMQEELKMYIIVRKDLDMSAGKVGAQVGHAVQNVIISTCITTEPGSTPSRRLDEWVDGSSSKIVLQDDGFSNLMSKYADLSIKLRGKALVEVVKDEARTELENSEYTCFALGPIYDSEAEELGLKEMRLYN